MTDFILRKIAISFTSGTVGKELRNNSGDTDQKIKTLSGKI
jgi:hypothetical protein